MSRNFSINEKVSCTKILSPLEQELLFRRFNNGIKLPKGQYISAKEAIIWIAKLGGYNRCRNSDPPSGIISVGLMIIRY